jgi:phage virion morphogenesis protein
VRVNVKADRLQTLVREARRRALDLSPAWEDIGEALLISIRKTFDAEGRPQRWAALTPAYRKARPSGKILTVRGIAGGLRGSIAKRSGKTFVAVGANKVYAAIHQFGGKTKAHVIKPRRKKALWFPGAGSFLAAGRGGGAVFVEHPLKSVNHPGSKIPARPYLVVQESDWDEFEAIMQEHVIGDLDGR